MDEDGHELFKRNVPNDPERLSEVLCGADPGTPVVFEAAYGWSWLAELLKNRGLELFSVGPPTPTLSNLTSSRSPAPQAN